MNYTINSRKLNKTVTFSRPGDYYIYVDLNGGNGTTGRQICAGGSLRGATLGSGSDSFDAFKRACKTWWRAYLREA